MMEERAKKLESKRYETRRYIVYIHIGDSFVYSFLENHFAHRSMLAARLILRENRAVKKIGDGKQNDTSLLLLLRR